MTALSAGPSWTHLDLSGGRRGPDLVRDLLAAPHLSDVRDLDLSRNDLGDDGLRALLAAPHLPPLTSLTLRDNHLGPAAAAALAADPRLASLTTLRLGDNPLGDAGLAALAASPHLRGLRTLDLRGAQLTGAQLTGVGLQTLATGAQLTGVGLQTLATSFPALLDLDLSDNQLGAPGIQALLSPHDGARRSWTNLVLAGNRIGPDGARHLAAASLPALRTLDLRDNQLGPDGAAALAGPLLASLQALDLSDNRTGDVGVQPLISAPGLVRIGLAGNQLTAKGVATLAASPRPALRELDLSDNSLATAGARSLAGAGWLAGLTRLDLTATQLSDAELALLAPRLTAIETLLLTANPLADPRPLATLPRLTSLDLSESALDLARLGAMLTTRGATLVELRLAAIPGGVAGLSALTAVPLPHLRRLDLAGWSLGDDGVRALTAAAARWPELAELDLGRNGLTDAAARLLADTPNLVGLAVLALPGNRISAAGARTLVASTHLTAVGRFDLRYNPVRTPDLSARTLRPVVQLSPDTTASQPQVATPVPMDAGPSGAGPPSPPGAAVPATLDVSHRHLDPVLLAEIDAALASGRIHALRLTGSQLDAAGVRALLGLPHASALQDLDLSANPLGDAGARAVADAAPAGLRSLALSACSIGEDGARPLAASPRLAGLERLDLAGNHLDASGIRHLATATFTSTLLSLTLSANPLGDEGARALAGGKLHPVQLALSNTDLGASGVRALLAGTAGSHLSALDLSDNPLGSEGGKLLSAFAGTPGLRSLILHQTALADAGVRALLAAPLTHLEILDLSDANLGDAAGSALAASPKLGNLRALDLRDNDFTPDVKDALRERFGDRVMLP